MMSFIRSHVASSIVVGLICAASPAAAKDFATGLTAYHGGKYVEAFRTWYPLAEADDARSQAGLGFLFHRGLGASHDDSQAAFWFEKAARQGQAEGQLMLGLLHYFGSGVPQSYVRAFAWCELAWTNGQADAQMCRDSALDSLSGPESRIAFRLVNELADSIRASRH
jgi:TPR repeat protein